jgi:hypothetical protein
VLDHIDDMLRTLLITRVPTVTDPLQVRFQPPDDDWRTYVSTLGKVALNVYLVEMRENRMLRSCGRTRHIDLGVVTEKPLPRYIDVNYLITAWDPATPQPGVEPTIVEHELLWNVASALILADPLTPSQIYFPKPLPAGFPAAIGQAELPTTVLPSEGFGKHAEFWGTMPGQTHPWRPAVLLTLTLPVLLPVIASGPMVTTLVTDYRLSADGSGKVEILADIGGTVFDETVVPAVPVAGVWVGLEDTAGVPLASTVTDAQGRFTFVKLRPDDYQLRFAAANHPAAPARNITVPSPTGEYDLQFT